MEPPAEDFANLVKLIFEGFYRKKFNRFLTVVEDGIIIRVGIVGKREDASFFISASIKN